MTVCSITWFDPVNLPVKSSFVFWLSTARSTTVWEQKAAKQKKKINKKIR